MSRWEHGLVIGKFRPPHKGHGLLIRTAVARVDRLTVLVCSDASDPIPARLRAAWLRELHPSARVRVVETTGHAPDDSRLWAKLTLEWLGRAPDVVFTSELYGEGYARYLDCAHVAVDVRRAQVPVAASRILARPLAHLQWLEPCVRAYFVPRVVLVGAESTGKTTLARALAAHYRTAWVPEYGRVYSEGLLDSREGGWTTADFIHIAESQQRLEDMLARHAHRVLICDTDAFVTRLWHERYLGVDAPALRALADARRYALYVLTGDEIPWVDDGTRERAAERHWFQARFREELQAQRKPSITVEGPRERHLADATAAVDQLLSTAAA